MQVQNQPLLLPPSYTTLRHLAIPRVLPCPSPAPSRAIPLFPSAIVCTNPLSQSLSRHNNDPHTPRLRHHTPHHRLNPHTPQPRLSALNPRNLPHVLQTHAPHDPQPGVPRRSALVETRLAFAPLGRLGPAYVACAFELVLDGGYACGGQEQRGGGRGAQVEGEAPVRADGDARGDGGAGDVVCGAGVEFLCRASVGAPFVLVVVGRAMGWCAYFAEVHGLDALAAQGGADGGRGRGLPGADDELDDLVFLEGFAGHGGGCGGRLGRGEGRGSMAAIEMEV